MPVQDRHLAPSARATALRRAASIATVALVAALVVGPLPVRHPAAAAAVACEEVQQRGAWTSITEIPGHEAQAPQPSISEWAVHPTDPNVFYVVVPEMGYTDEISPGILEGSLIRSTDGGCSWDEILTDDDLNPPVAGATEDFRSPRRVDAVGVAADGTIYVSVFMSSGSHADASLESVWVSRDRGANWERFTQGLPVIAEGCVNAYFRASCPLATAPVNFYPAPSDPQTVYLLTGSYNNRYTDVYATTNGGKSWEARTVYAETPPQETYVDDCFTWNLLPLPPQGPCTDSGLNGEYRPGNHMQFPLMTGLIVDPVNPQELWALRIEETEAERNERWAKEGSAGAQDLIGPRLVHSVNGGAEWNRIPVRGHTIPVWDNNPHSPGGAMLSVFHKAGQPAHLFVTADVEKIDVPDDQVCQACAREKYAYSILTSSNNGESWTALARVEIPMGYMPLFLGTGSASPQNMVLAYAGASKQGPDHARVHRYDKRSGSWVEASPDHLYEAEGDWWPQLDRADVRMVRSGKDTYLVAEYGYETEGGSSGEVSIQKYLLPRR